VQSVLDTIKNWEERARKARFQVARLARECGVSERQLRSYVRVKFRTPPHAWMMAVRLGVAPALLAQGFSVKRISAELGFSQPSHFSREFKQFYGVSPVEFRFSKKISTQTGDSDTTPPV